MTNQSANAVCYIQNIDIDLLFLSPRTFSSSAVPDPCAIYTDWQSEKLGLPVLFLNHNLPSTS